MTMFRRDLADERSYGRRLATCCAVAFAGYFGSYMRMPVVPLYARSLGFGPAEIGAFSSAFFFVAGILSLPVGGLSDRLGRRPVAVGGLAVVTIASALLYLSSGFSGLVASHVLLGVGVAAFGPTMMSLAVDCSPPTHMGRTFGWYTTALYTGMSLGPAFGGFLARKLGYRPVFLVSCLLALAVVAAAARFLPAPHSGSRNVPKDAPPRGAVRQLVGSPTLLGCWLAALGGCFGLGMFATFFPLHGQERGLSVAQIGLAFFVQGGFNAASRIPLGRWTDRVSDRRGLVVVGLGGFAAALVGLGATHALAGFLFWSAAMGVSMALAFTSVGALTAEATPPVLRGLAMGGYNACVFFGMMLNAALMGRVAQARGFSVSFAVTAAVIVATTVGFLVLTKRPAPKVSVADTIA